MYRLAMQVRAAVADQPLTEVWFAFAHLQRHAADLQQQQLIDVSTVGKALLLKFSNEVCVYTHNQLYGRWLFSRPDRRPDTRRQLRLALSTSERSALLYSASTIELIAAEELHAHPFIQRAGLDILSADVNDDQIVAWISQARFAGRKLGHLLLDQGFLAGVGNYLRSEILFAAGLHHACRLRDLTEDDKHKLAAAARTLFWRSVKTAGITNTADRVAQLRKAGWKRRDYRHHVFGREGQSCFICAAAICKTTVSGRRLYHCPRCQPATG
jgi:endonuclease-8